MKFATIEIVLTLIIICSSGTLVGQDTNRKQGVNVSAGNFVGEDAMHDEGMLAYCGSWSR